MDANDRRSASEAAMAQGNQGTMRIPPSARGRLTTHSVANDPELWDTVEPVGAFGVALEAGLMTVAAMVLEVIGPALWRRLFRITRQLRRAGLLVWSVGDPDGGCPGGGGELEHASRATGRGGGGGVSEVQPCLTHEWKVEGGRLVCEQCPILGPSVVDALAAIFEAEHPVLGSVKERIAATDRALEQANEWVKSPGIYRLKVEAEGWAEAK